MIPEAHPGSEIVSTRDFAAPPETLFQAFSDPVRVAQWWGPSGFTTTVHEFDFRPGGAWRLTMHGPDGADYENLARFVEVVRPERIVFQHEEPVHRFRMTMTFAPRGSGTTLTWRMRFETTEEVARIGGFVATANEENFDRLAAHLNTST
ncbi:MAG TPA: SRPBCC family protein [Opitutus sp.]|nr:SRPBCC family protein [Opitutus sp.]